jgi:hypothetical protein
MLGHSSDLGKIISFNCFGIFGFTALALRFPSVSFENLAAVYAHVFLGKYDLYTAKIDSAAAGGTHEYKLNICSYIFFP